MPRPEFLPSKRSSAADSRTHYVHAGSNPKRPVLQSSLGTAWCRLRNPPSMLVAIPSTHLAVTQANADGETAGPATLDAEVQQWAIFFDS
jgi:hypothetical protein